MRGWKERLAAAHDHRVDEEVVFVDEIELDAVSREPGTADLEVAVNLLLETADLLGDAVGGKPRAPVDALEDPRKDDLRERLPDLRELAPRRPELEVLVGGLPVEHRLVQTAAAEMRAEPAYPIGVEAEELLARRSPAEIPVRTGDESVRRNAHGVDQLGHRSEAKAAAERLLLGGQRSRAIWGPSPRQTAPARPRQANP